MRPRAPLRCLLWNSLSSGRAALRKRGDAARRLVGRHQRLNADTTGQIDFARSSRGPNTGETTTLDFWAYALGALDYVIFPGTHAPAQPHPDAAHQHLHLRRERTERRKADGQRTGRRSVAPPGAIVKYQPQTGSGTTASSTRSCSTARPSTRTATRAHQSVSLQEHDARGVTAVSKANAIYAFDWARWQAQIKGFEAEPPQRCGARQAERHVDVRARRRSTRRRAASSAPATCTTSCARRRTRRATRTSSSTSRSSSACAQPRRFPLPAPGSSAPAERPR